MFSSTQWDISTVEWCRTYRKVGEIKLKQERICQLKENQLKCLRGVKQVYNLNDSRKQQSELIRNAFNNHDLIITSHLQLCNK